MPTESHLEVRAFNIICARSYYSPDSFSYFQAHFFETYIFLLQFLAAIHCMERKQIDQMNFKLMSVTSKSVRGKKRGYKHWKIKLEKKLDGVKGGTDCQNAHLTLIVEKCHVLLKNQINI